MSRRPLFRRPALRRGRFGLLSLFLVLALVALWLGAFLQFIESLPPPVVEEPLLVQPQRDEAAVVLTGGAVRLSEGLNLLERRLADRLLVSGVNPTVDKAALGEVAGRADLLDCCVDLGFTARNTEENAREIAEWAHAHGYARLRVVTAAYHMPRSLLELRRVAPEIGYLPHPVFPEQIRLHDWWRWPGTVELLVGEFHKYLAALLRATAEHRLRNGRGTGAPAPLQGEPGPGDPAPARATQRSAALQ